VLTVAMAVIALAITATAHAASTRAEYVAQVDPICQTATVQVRRALNKHHLKNAILLDDLGSGDRKAELRIVKQLHILHRFGAPAVEQIAAVPAPPGDEAVIARWVGDLRFYDQRSLQAASAIRAGKSKRARHLILGGLRDLVAVDDELRPWGFQSCL
jgi:hypothetical protein